MRFFRQTRIRYLLPWALLLSMAIVCAQGVKLHIHDISHDHEKKQQHSHISTKIEVEHSHLSIAHLSTDVSHVDHHDEVVSELDINPDSLVKKISSSALLLALFSIAVTLFFAIFLELILYPCRGVNTFLPGRHLLSPPLRAPPL